MSEAIRVAISSCLLGEAVRYDGGHKRDSCIIDTLGKRLRFEPICPEVAIGLPVPRAPIHLVQYEDGVHVVGVEDPTVDVTDRLHACARRMAQKMDGISGFIFKHASPSCGMAQVRLHAPDGRLIGRTSGAFAGEIRRAHPLLPIEEEGRLGEAHLRENFVMRVYVYHRWQRLLAEGVTAERLRDFFVEFKYLLMAHSQSACKRIGRLLANSGGEALAPLAERFARELMEALATPASRAQHVNVLQHLLGYLKRDIDAADKAQMLEVIRQYREGRVALVVPLNLLRHHFRNHPAAYIARQFYLSPSPYWPLEGESV